MEFRVLGPLEVCTAGGEVPLTGPKRRALLALFLVNAGQVISVDRLADDLWQGEPPKSAATTLQTFVYQLRRKYGVEALRTMAAGYVLDVEPEQIDAARFERAVDAALAVATQTPAAAMDQLRDALALWRGPAYAEFAAEPWATAESARLEEVRLDAVEAWAATAIGADRTTGVAGELDAWTSRHPLRESLWAVRVLALATEGRSAEAMRACTNLRAVLGEELGVDPSGKFLAIETAIVRNDPIPDFPELGGFGLSDRPAPTRVETEPAPAPAPPPATPRPPRRKRRPRADTPIRIARADPFVGRNAERQRLDDALESASSGRPQVVLITGEAGIGKSRLLHEFTPRAIASGAQVLRGACQEDVGVPYLAIATAFANLGTEDDRTDPFGALTAVDAPETVDARLRLFLGASRVLLDAARDRATVLIIEDIHWSDDATLGLLRHLLAIAGEEAADQRARLLVVVTSRPPDHAAVAGTFVARLRREHGPIVIPVGALEQRDCQELIVEWLGQPPVSNTMQRLVEASGGNPLVLRSVLARLDDSDPMSDTALAEFLGPTDLDHELWHRIDSVGPTCIEMLLDAAFLGDGSELELLATASGRSAAEIDELVEEASAHAVLVSDDERYWFDHPQLRQLIYHWESGPERSARHLALADRLEAHGADIVVIAHHCVRARDVLDPARLLSVCDTAAARAAAIGAWRDSARYATVALIAAETIGQDEVEFSETLFRAGHAALLAGDHAVAIAHLTGAADRARACDAIATWGRALSFLGRLGVLTEELRSTNAQSLHRLDEFLDQAGTRAPALRAEIHALESELYFNINDGARARRHVAEAEELATGIDDDALQVRVAFARGLQLVGSVELDGAEDRFETARAIATKLSDHTPRTWCLARLGLIAYARGNLERATEILNEAIAVARVADNNADSSMASAILAAVCVAQGRSATVELHSARARRSYEIAEYWFTPTILFPTLAAGRADRGDRAGAHAALDEWDATQGRRSRRYRPLVDLFTGAPEAARAYLEATPFRLFTSRTAPDLLVASAVAAQVEIGALTAMPDLVRGPLDTLFELYERGMRFTLGWPTFLPRVIALGLNALDRDDEAKTWFDRALEDAIEAGATVEIGRTALDHARILVDAGADGTGRARAARAAYDTISIEPKMSGSELLARSTSPVAPVERAEISHGTRIVLVTDLVDSTRLNDELGDATYLALLRRHDEVIRRRLEQYDGVEFKHTGDGIAAWFFSATNALRCAGELMEDFNRDSGAEVPMHIRIALAAGEPSLVDGDLLGIAVTLAFRVADVAEANEILVTGDVAGLARGSGWQFESSGRRQLKGISEAVELARVRPM